MADVNENLHHHFSKSSTVSEGNDYYGNRNRNSNRDELKRTTSGNNLVEMHYSALQRVQSGNNLNSLGKTPPSEHFGFPRTPNEVPQVPQLQAKQLRQNWSGSDLQHQAPTAEAPPITATQLKELYLRRNQQVQPQSQQPTKLQQSTQFLPTQVSIAQYFSKQPLPPTPVSTQPLNTSYISRTPSNNDLFLLTGNLPPSNPPPSMPLPQTPTTPTLYTRQQTVDIYGMPATVGVRS
ncbi:hypothetical protein HK096_005271, partial [Nowakowskiella sp. JEL0078]